MTVPSRRQLWLLALAAVCAAIVLAIFPFRLIAGWPHDDAVAHLLSGVALAAVGAAGTRRVDDHILAVALAIGVGWELVESVWFQCVLGPAGPCAPELVTWWGDDTLLDVALVVLGALAVLLATGRYR